MNMHQTRVDRPRADDEGGFVIIGVLLLSTLLMALGVFGTTNARTEVQIAHNDVLYKQALAVAEAGLSHAIPLLKVGYPDGFDNELSSDGTGGALTALGSAATIGGHAARFRDFGHVSGDGYFVWITDNYDETPDDPADDDDRRIRLLSLGQVGSAVRTVEATLQGSSLFPRAGLFGDEEVVITGGSIVDSYDASVGPYPNGDGDEGNVGSNGNVSMAGSGATINGDATAHGTVNYEPSVVTGEITEGAESIPLDPVTPCGPPYSDGTGISGGTYNATKGELKSGGSTADITLSPGTYCFASVTLKSGNSLSITGVTKILLTDKSDFSGGVLMNPGTPRDFLIISSYAGTGDGIKVAGGSMARAGIYAPEAEVKLTGGGEFFGSLVGERIEVNGGTLLHYDDDLQHVPGSQVNVVGWREMRNP